MKATSKALVGSGLIVLLGLALGAYLRPVSFSGSADRPESNPGPSDPRAVPTEGGPLAAAAPGEAPAPVMSGKEEALSPVDAKKIAVLTEILISKNDNDPRMDTELRNFSPAAKAVIARKYSETVSERRNERGTLVFLLGREIQDPSELAFFGKVLSEKACLSLENCEKPPEGHSGEEEHLEAVNETTANYPQLVALRALVHRANELVDTGQEGSPLYSRILDTLRGALQSPNGRVAEEAGKALEELKRE